jgi:hypothetical protein
LNLGLFVTTKLRNIQKGFAIAMKTLIDSQYLIPYDKDYKLYTGNHMSHFFMSYSRRDLEIVDKYVHALAETGMNAWVDREDIKVGNSWRVQIVEAIDTCDAFVFFLSSNSAASTNVHKEVILAQDSGCPTYVVMLEVVRLPAAIRYQLAGLQFINAPLLGFEKSAQILIDALKPHIKKKTDEESIKQTELVIQGIDISAFDAEKQKQLLAFVASLTNTDTAQLSIANMTAGSVHIFIDMPAAAAYQLKALALNADPRFKQLGIVSLRITGDTLFVHTTSGALDPSPKPNPVQAFFSSLYGKIIAIFLLILILLGLTTFLPQQTTPSASDPTATWSATPTITTTLTETPSATATQTVAQIPTETPTSTPIVYQIMSAVVANERIACNYGPGDLYLNNEALRSGVRLQVFGTDINSGWAYVLADGFSEPCWVNLNAITLDGEIENLEPVYPGEVHSHPPITGPRRKMYIPPAANQTPTNSPFIGMNSSSNPVTWKARMRHATCSNSGCAKAANWSLPPSLPGTIMLLLKMKRAALNHPAA